MPDTKKVVMDLAATEETPPEGTGLVLNMIIGNFREPYLPACLDALASQVNWAVVNINGNDEYEETQWNLKAVLDSRFNQEDRLTILGLRFRNYAFNRNVCLEASRNCEWMVQMDPDEVLYPTENLQQLVEEAEREGCTRVLGHYWHFLKSHEKVHNQHALDPQYFKPFMWKISDQLSWHGAVHERLVGPTHSDLITMEPLWCHFGYVDPVTVFHKWQWFAQTEGRPDFYAGYFNDPQAPWRKGPENVLDDRTQFPYTDLRSVPVVPRIISGDAGFNWVAL